MKKIFILSILLCVVVITKGTNYYFSSISGDDGRVSTSPDEPWKTLDKLNSIYSSLLPGDSVLLKRGETFYGSITVNNSGTANLPIVIGAYGTGPRPVITSLITLTGWVSLGGGVWESEQYTALQSPLQVVTVDNIPYGIGRYPDPDEATGGYLYYELQTTNTITDNQLAASPNWTGADVVIRTSRWTIDKGPITSHAATKITFTPYPNAYAPKDDYGYFIQNHEATLTKFGEWYYNPATDKIKMFFGASLPTAHTIQAATINNLVLASAKSNVVFDNITFKGSNDDCIKITSGSNMIIKNCDVMFSGRDGVASLTTTNLRIEDCNITYCYTDGIRLGTGSTNAMVTNNYVYNTYYVAGMGQSGNGHGTGIRNGDNSTVQYNRVINSGYIGIILGGNNSRVLNNFIDSTCFIKDDGGGIYTFVGSANTVYTGRKIEGNIVLNGIGAGAGTPDRLSSSAAGIYMDDIANGVEIKGNTVANISAYGIFFHDSHNILATGNTVFNSGTQVLFVDDGGVRPLRTHTIKNNIFFAKAASQWTASFKTSADDIAQMGIFDDNYYARPIDDRVSILNVRYLYGTNEIYEYHDLERWKTRYPGIDVNSKISSKGIVPYKNVSLAGADKIAAANSTFNTSEGWCCDATVWGNSGQMDGGYLVITPSATEKKSISLVVGVLDPAKYYILRFSIKGSANSNQSAIAAFLRYGGTPFLPISPLQYRKVTTSREEIEMIFKPTVSEATGTLAFEIAEGGPAIYMDNIQLFEATATVTNIDDSIRFEYNATKGPKTIVLNRNYTDVKGEQYTTVTLQPYTSVILLKSDASASISSSQNASVFGENVTFTSTVALDAPGTGTRTGTVTFFDGETSIGTVPLDAAGSANITVSSLSAGTHSITAVYSGDENFNSSTSEVLSQVVNQASPVVTAAIGATFLYEGTSHGGSGTATGVDGQSLAPVTLSYKGTGSTVYPVSPDAPTNAGTYQLTASYSGDANYSSATSVPVDFAITPASLTITASDQTKIYGQVVYLAGTEFITTTLQHGETVGSVTLTSTGIPASASAGTYDIIPSNATGGTFIASNYTINYIPGKLTVNPRAITITADPQSKIYGNADELTYQITAGSLVGDDAFTGSLARQNGEDIGSYAIHQGSVALNSNYDLSYVGANLTITPREITIKADPKTKALGAPDPTLTYYISNGSLVNGDVFTGSLTRVAGEALGNYPILQNSVALNNNYNLSYEGDNLVITNNPITNATLVINGTIACNGGTTTLTASAGGGNGTFEYSLNGGAYQSGNTFTVNAVGSPYTVTVKDANQVTSTTNTVTVTEPVEVSVPVVTVVNNCGTSTLSTTATGTLLWSTGASTSSITVSTAGTYTVVQTVNGCTSAAGSGIAAPNATLSTPVITVVNNCGTSTLSTTATGTLLWSTGATSSSITVSTAGTYTVKRTVNGCTSAEGSATAAPKAVPSVPVVAVVNNCGSSTLSTTATGSLLWSTGATTSSITVSTAGTYTVKRTVNGCTSAAGSGIAAPKAVPSAPVVTVVNSCGSSKLSTTATGSLLWSTGATTSSITVTAPGTYTVKRTVNGCTSAAGSATVKIDQTPSAGTISGASTVCIGKTTTFTSNGNSGGSWSSSNTAVAKVTASTGVITGVVAGTSTIKYTVTNSCGSTYATKSITVASNTPTVTCRSGSPFTRNAGTTCKYTISGTEFNLTAYNSCNGTLSYTMSGATTGTGTSLAGKQLNKGSTKITWKSTIGTLSSSCSITVNVVDNQAPIITCKPGATKTIAQSSSGYIVSGTEFNATASDNCGTPSLIYSLIGATVAAYSATNTSLAGKKLNIGTTTITWKATDGNNKVSTCTTTVNVSKGTLISRAATPVNRLTLLTKFTSINFLFLCVR